MNDKPLAAHLRELESRINELIAETKRLKGENYRLKTELDNREAELQDFQNSAKISKLVGSINPEGEDAEMLKSRIENNIRIIDKCIAHLSKTE